MSIELYYTAPAQPVFDEIKRCAKAIWLTYDDEFGYATEKITKVDAVGNVGDNWMYLVAMFDQRNQGRLFALLSPSTVELIMTAMS